MAKRKEPNRQTTSISNAQRIVFIVIGAVVILSMVISLIAK
jgi:hypothetical protein